jgi:hypothetical protein
MSPYADKARNVLHVMRFASLPSDGHASALRHRQDGAVSFGVNVYAEADKRTVGCNSMRKIESEFWTRAARLRAPGRICETG